MTTRSRFRILTASALALIGAVNASAQGLSIDDFTTGPTNPGSLALRSTGMRESSQFGPGILGGTRCITLHVTGNPLGRPASVEVRDGTDGYLAVDTGVNVDHAMVLLYGYDSDCNAVGLNYDLTNYDHFRLHFEAVDLGTAGAVVVFTDGGSASIPLGVPEGLNGTIDVAFARFTGDPDWQHVQQIAIVIQSGGLVAAHDYALRSVSAVSCQFEVMCQVAEEEVDTAADALAIVPGRR
jgi:hypothetical protein